MDEDNDDNDVAMPHNVACISPDMPSCASGMSGNIFLSLFVVHFYCVHQFHQTVQPERHTCKDQQCIYYVTSSTCFGLFSHLQER